MAFADFILMLVSSVLVSKNASAFGAIGSEVPRSRRPKEEEYCEEWLTVAALEQQDDSSPAEQIVIPDPLSSLEDEVGFKWTFWYDDTTSKKKLNRKDYLHNLHRLSTVSTLPEFNREWKNIHEKLIPVFEPETNYRFFRHDILPMWEDSHNTEGGKWVVVFRQKPGFKTLEFWRSLLLAMMHGELGHQQDICGAVLSVRSWGFMYTIWNKDATYTFQIEDVARKLEKIFGTPKIKYQSHKDAIFKTSAATKKQLLIEKNLKKAKKLQEKENRCNNPRPSPSSESREKIEFQPVSRVLLAEESSLETPQPVESTENSDDSKNLHAGISSDNESAEAHVTENTVTESSEVLPSEDQSIPLETQEVAPSMAVIPSQVPSTSTVEVQEVSSVVPSESPVQFSDSQLPHQMPLSPTEPALANLTKIAVAAVSGILLGWTVAVTTTAL